MDIREYLLQCCMLCGEIECLKERLAALREMKDGIMAFCVREIASRRPEDRISAMLAEIELLEELYVRKVTLALRLKYDYQMLFDRIPDRKLRMLLELKYIDMLSWDEIADRMFYSTRSCYNMHKAALALAQKIRDGEKSGKHDIARCAWA
ncbi:MAG: DUF1492 domain-containing protein [Defluviitaleaceae bacterium]|nr:DUF1492 domain-containing protein [Defluviitaleaceae bacterium]